LADMMKAGNLLMIACLLFSSPFLWQVAGAEASSSISFLGAAQTIGGSAYLIEADHLRLLLDFGAIPDDNKREGNQDLAFDPALLDFVLLTHAHSDHAGRIPVLFRKGFKGRVIGTEATRALLRLTLEQTLKINEERGVAEYGREDIERTLTNYLAVPYDKKVFPSPGFGLRLHDAGHILGSAMMELWLKEGFHSFKIIATGDMGSGLLPMFPPPAIIDEGDYIIVESTYGPSKRQDTHEETFGLEVRKTLLSGGSVLIPAFTLDRTQRVLYVIGRLKKAGVIPADTPVYADSLSAASISRVYRSYGAYFRRPSETKPPSRDDFLIFPRLLEIRGPVSLAAHDRGLPAIFVTSSGMMDHGQAPRHLERMIDDSRNLLAIVGWQAPGTLGYDLQKGTKVVRIPVGEKGDVAVSVERSVKMRVKSFGVFGNHADGCGVLAWLAHFPKARKVMVVHGEKEGALDLAKLIRDNLGFPALAPALGDVVPLSTSDPDYPRRKNVLPCRGVSISRDFSFPAD